MGTGARSVRALTPDDADALLPFDPDGNIGPALGMHTDGVGVWDGDTLIAVSTWRVYGAEWASTLISVLPQWRRQGIATDLKKQLVMRAHAAGASHVRSTIAWGNDPMIALNAKLGARIVWDRPVLGKPQWVEAFIDLR